MQEIVWLGLLAVLILIEIATLGLVTIWFAGGALVAFIVALFTENILIQVIAFLVVSFLLLFFTRPVAAKYFNSKRTKTNVDSLVGETCKVTEEIDNFNGTGAVLLNGLVWTARSKDDTKLSVGTCVRVCRIEGVKAIVEEKEENAV